jgi:hypothetical protein
MHSSLDGDRVDQNTCLHEALACTLVGVHTTTLNEQTDTGNLNLNLNDTITNT